MSKIKIGDKVKVISQGWKQHELVGRTGLVVFIRNGVLRNDYLILFDCWHGGHNDGVEHKDTHNYSSKNCNCYWWLGAREADKIELVSLQLEFNFNG